MKTKICKYCNENFLTKQSKQKYCSIKCFGMDCRGKPHPIPPLTQEHKDKIRLSQLGKPRPQTSNEKNGWWKGDKATKEPIHKWVVRRLGKPDTCDFCGRSGLFGHQINWANIDHTYQRVLSDYMRLCVPCHRLYDSSRGVKIGR